MSQPTPFVPSYDFSVEMPGDDGNALDAMQDDLQLTLDETLANLALIQKDDGGLRNGLVTPFTLSTDTVALLSDWTVRGAWVTVTAYSELDLVTESGIAYLCLVDHVSGTFATDLAAGKWTALSKVDSAASAFSLTLMDDANAGAWLTTLGFSAFVKTLVDDADAAAFLTTLGVSAFVQTVLNDADAAAVRTTIGAYGSGSNIVAGTITASGLVEVGGNLEVAFELIVDGTTTLRTLLDISSSTAGQIEFPATQNASSNANTLDDYEEGTWTPSLGGNTTYNAQVGSYTKVGRLVTVSCYLDIATIGTGSTSQISGLPFTAGVSSQYYIGPVIFTGFATNVTCAAVRLPTGQTTAVIYSIAAAGASMSALAVLGNSTVLYFTMSYNV